MGKTVTKGGGNIGILNADVIIDAFKVKTADGIRQLVTDAEAEITTVLVTGSGEECQNAMLCKSIIEARAPLAIANAEVRDAERNLADLEAWHADLREQGQPLLKTRDDLQAEFDRVDAALGQAKQVVENHFRKINSFELKNMEERVATARFNLKAVELGMSPSELIAKRKADEQAARRRERQQMRDEAKITYNREHAIWAEKNRVYFTRNGPHPGPEPILHTFQFADE